MSAVDQRAEEILKRLPPPGDPAVPTVFVAEVGAWDGRLSQRLLQRPDLILYMVDRWAAVSPSHPYFHSGAEIARKSQAEHLAARDKALARTVFAGRRAIVCRGESVDVAMLVTIGLLHLAFIDANHAYDAVMDDLIAWWPNVGVGGWIGGHDWDHPEHKGEWGVRQAVEDWCEENGIEGPVELGQNHTWFVRKESVE